MSTIKNRLILKLESYDEMLLLIFKGRHDFFRVQEVLRDHVILTGFFEKYETSNLGCLRGLDFEQRMKQRDNEFEAVDKVTGKTYLARYFVRSFLNGDKRVRLTILTFIEKTHIRHHQP